MRHLVMILMLVFSAVEVVNANNLSCKEHACIAVVDAGSTGSRIHLYAYDNDNGTPENIKEVFSKKINPGHPVRGNANPQTGKR